MFLTDTLAKMLKNIFTYFCSEHHYVGRRPKQVVRRPSRLVEDLLDVQKTHQMHRRHRSLRRRSVRFVVNTNRFVEDQSSCVEDPFRVCKRPQIFFLENRFQKSIFFLFTLQYIVCHDNYGVKSFVNGNKNMQHRIFVVEMLYDLI